MSEQEFIPQGFLKKVVDSDQLSKGRRTTFYNACPVEEKRRFDEQESLTLRYIARAVRERLHATQAPMDTWEWLCATSLEGWTRTPVRGAKTAEQYLIEGRETRYVPVHSQTLPCIAEMCYRNCKMLPESRAGWVDSYMCRTEAEKAIAGVYTFLQLNQWQYAVTFLDSICDGNLYAFFVEVQVVPEGVASDSMRNSYGGIFYQEAVVIVFVFCRADTLGVLKRGDDNPSKGTDVKIFPQPAGEPL
jgi:hypothetical protein